MRLISSARRPVATAVARAGVPPSPCFRGSCERPDWCANNYFCRLLTCMTCSFRVTARLGRTQRAVHHTVMFMTLFQGAVARPRVARAQALVDPQHYGAPPCQRAWRPTPAPQSRPRAPCIHLCASVKRNSKHTPHTLVALTCAGLCQMPAGRPARAPHSAARTRDEASMALPARILMPPPRFRKCLRLAFAFLCFLSSPRPLAPLWPRWRPQPRTIEPGSISTYALRVFAVISTVAQP